MLCLGTALALTLSAGQVPAEDFVRLSSGPPPRDVRTCLGYIADSFEVESTPGGRVVVTPQALARDDYYLPLSSADVSLPEDANRHSIVVEDGWLVGFDAGEFGGGLWSVRRDGQHVRVPLEGVPSWARNVHGLVPQPDGPLAFVGLAHLSAEYGAVLRCARLNGQWKATLVARIGGTPTAVGSEANGGAVFVTARTIGRVSPSGAVQTLLRRDFDGLYPASVATDTKGNIYVGMRGVVVRLAVGAKQEDWLVPPDCVRLELDGRRCTCLR
jgi:hypothetical protein